MKHTLTIEFDSAADLAAFLSGNANDAPNAGAAKASAASAGGASSGTAAKKAAGQKAPVEPEPAGSESQFTYEEISAKVLEVSKTKGRDSAVNLLGQYKAEDGTTCTKGAQVQPSDYDDLMEKAEAILEDLG